MYKKSQVGQNAKIDAKNNIPGVNDKNPSQFEQELMAMARHEALGNTNLCSRIMNGSPRTMMLTPPRLSGASPA